MGLLYGLLNRSAATLVSTWLMQEHKLPQIEISQLINTILHYRLSYVEGLMPGSVLTQEEC